MNKEISRIYSLVVEESQKEFGSDLHSVYVIGSLAHGGFSDAISDLDVGIVLLSNPITSMEWDKISKIEEVIESSRHPYSDRVSIFWTNVITLESEVPSGAFPTTTKEFGSFPSFDILDLIQNGEVIFGQDIRGLARVPSRDELFVCGVEFLLSYVDSPKRNCVIVSYKDFCEISVSEASKTILFPVRLMSTLLTGKIGGNDFAYNCFKDSVSCFGLEDTLIVDMAMAARESSEIPFGVIKDRFTDLYKLYINLIMYCKQEMKRLDEKELVRGLESWLDRLNANK